MPSAPPLHPWVWLPPSLSSFEATCCLNARRSPARCRWGLTGSSACTMRLGATPPSVGLENLALAMVRNGGVGWNRTVATKRIASVGAQGMEDVLNQGPFIKAMLAPLGDQGIMLLDLHNLYCQILNSSLPAEEAIKRLAGIAAEKAVC